MLIEKTRVEFPGPNSSSGDYGIFKTLVSKHKNGEETTLAFSLTAHETTLKGPEVLQEYL